MYTKILMVICGLAILLFLLLVVSNKIIEHNARGKVFGTIHNIPKTEYAIVLGTNPRLESGKDNPYFVTRIDAAVKLYTSGKVKYLIMSGNDKNGEFNEPHEMKIAAVKKGVPAKSIILDAHCKRTYDTILRAKLIYHLKSFIVVSQKFHNERAVYLANKNGLEVVGYNAKDIDGYFSFKTRTREYFARIRAFSDGIFNPKPYSLQIDSVAYRQFCR